jgi:hypothetical protein
MRRVFMRRSGVISLILLGVFVFAVCASVPAGANDSFIKNVLPAHGFAEDWVMNDPLSLYTRDTLFDHINGEAELYFPYGFDMLATAAYVNKRNPEVWVVADVYRMASLLDAFGIYANYRRADAVEVPIGAEGFSSSSQLMFYQDRYFVRIQATGTTRLEQDIFLACGRAIAQNLPPNAGRPGQIEALRIPGVIPKSERYIAQSLLGYAFFRRGMTADAILKGEQVQVFVVPEDSQNTARKAFDQYRSYLKAEGRDICLTETSDRISLSAVDPLYGGVFVEQSGRYIIGAVRVKESSTAKQLVEQLRGRFGGR